MQFIGVVPDFSVESVRRAAPPAAYGIMPYPMEFMSIKIKPDHMAQTRSAINSMRSKLSHRTPSGYFLKGYLKSQFADMEKLSAFVSICGGVALAVACLRLFGLSAFGAEQRIGEIGIRKAMGADRIDIIQLLATRYAVPLLAANLLAWPVAYVVMSRWFQVFADHVDIELWIFVSASTVAFGVGWVTVCAHAFLIAGLKPAGALRYE